MTTELREFEDAIRLTALKYSELDVRSVKLTGRGLADLDLTWQERISEVWARVHALAWEDRPSHDLVAAATAHLVALLIALERAERVDPAAGEAA